MTLVWLVISTAGVSKHSVYDSYGPLIENHVTNCGPKMPNIFFTFFFFFFEVVDLS